MSIAFNTKSEELKKIATHVVEGNDFKEILNINQLLSKIV